MLIPSKSSCVIGCAQILAELGGIQKEEFGIATSIRKQVSVWKHVDFVLVDNTFVWKSLGPRKLMRTETLVVSMAKGYRCDVIG